MTKHFLYKGRRTNEISFPLGGIGTGCIGLAGNGRLIDWEIFNRPNKGSVNGFSHFAVKAESKGRIIDARILQGDLHPPYSGPGSGTYAGFGFGVRREDLTGLPHFKTVDFRGEYPLAELEFKGAKFPGQVKLRAFNPFIPLNADDSGIPAAFFEIELTNTSRMPLDYTVSAVLGNPLPANNLNRIVRKGKTTTLLLDSDKHKPSAVEYGQLALSTDARSVSVQRYWFRGPWFDNLGVYWQELSSPGRFKDRAYQTKHAGDKNHGLLAVHLKAAPGKTVKARFVISWSFPNCENYWDGNAAKRCCEKKVKRTWKNYYATQFKSAAGAASYALKNWDTLYGATLSFKRALFDSSLPPGAIDAISANISILKTPTVLRLEDGTFYGWEGCHATAGCCEGSCTHVWNYQQALPFLFPKLERSMREANYRYNLGKEGGMAFRLQVPLGSGHSGHRPCADGQFGDVMKTYRDWKVCGDDKWLKKLWPAVKKSIEYAWHPKNPDRWDPEKTGVLTGRQHHTLDMELFGPSSWLNGFYLGALKAGAEMAARLGEIDAAEEYSQLFEKGRRWTEQHLFNGEYYIQLIDLEDKGQLEPFDQAVWGGPHQRRYWNAEHGEVKYQIGEGCSIDQVLAQWHADLYGLGDIFDPARTKQALRAVFKHNFKKPMGEHANPCRIYCLNDEAGLVICSWPAGKKEPVIPVPYSQEAMHGFEYAAAIAMIQHGLLKEGMQVVEAVRERYDGEKRNPWNEIECGSNYARSMASYALLNAFSGFRFDLANGMIGFDPVTRGNCRFLWSLEGGWGEFAKKGKRAEISVIQGELKLSRVELPFVGGRARVSLSGKKVACSVAKGVIEFERAVVVRAGRVLSLM